MDINIYDTVAPIVENAFAAIENATRMDEIDAIVEDAYAEIDAAVLSDVISDKMDEFDDFVDSLGYDYSADEDFINLVDEYKLSFTAATSVAELNEIYNEAVSALEDYISNLDAENDPENDPVTE